MEAERVLDYWFGASVDDPEVARTRGSFWFGGSPEVDREIAERFGPLVDAAASGALADWEGAPRSALALVLLLDQFPRNIWRGRPYAFRHDEAALRAARAALARGHLEELAPLEAAFLILPFEHAEALDCQREAVRLYRELVERAPAEWRPLLGEFVDAAQEHCALIERFGRFPHRNRLLGRESTELERRHLASGGAGFGQGQQRDRA